MNGQYIDYYYKSIRNNFKARISIYVNFGITLEAKEVGHI